MSKFALALLLLFGLPAAAVDACSALNPIEIAATLRGPGTVVAFRSKGDQDHLHTCFFARVSQAGSFEENVKRIQSENALILTVVVADGAGSNGFSLLKPDSETKDIEVPGIGERAVLRHGAKGEKLFVATSSNFLIVGLGGGTAPGQHEQDLLVLAQEAIATNFDGSKVVRYEVADRALANDKAAFEADPKNSAALLFAMNRLDEARTYNLRAAAANPNDPDVLYLQGVLDWEAAYKLRTESRSRLALTALQPLTSGQACAAIRAANHVRVEQGIADLSKAITLRPDFGDAMAYLNLMYRERADYECDNAAARAADLRSADDWVDKTMATKKAMLGKDGGRNAASLFPPVPTPPPPPLNAASAPQRVQVSQGLSQGLLVTQVSPAYPQLARQARIQGTVVLRAVISKDGSIESLSLVSGHPMLVPAAMDAVKQWKYKPYFLNGEPVEVETTINVNFTLARG